MGNVFKKKREEEKKKYCEMNLSLSVLSHLLKKSSKVIETKLFKKKKNA